MFKKSESYQSIEQQNEQKELEKDFSDGDLKEIDDDFSFSGIKSPNTAQPGKEQLKSDLFN